VQRVNARATLSLRESGGTYLENKIQYEGYILKRSDIGRSSSDTVPAKAVRPGQLRIGNDWHAISIIAQSQSNPLKAIAEFVENSIDARANRIVITRCRQRGAHYLRITDDGEGIRKNAEGTPDFAYVAAHTWDSIKRELTRQGAAGIQGELLRSFFW